MSTRVPHPPHNRPRAFTLIELMVTIALFSIVMTIVGAAYINLINLEHQARATNDLSDNLSFAVDTMSRAMRTGTLYQCGNGGGNGAQDCVSGNSEINFTDQNGNIITYILTNTNQVGECINLPGNSCSSDRATAVTDPRITITNLMFYVTGSQSYSTSGDRRQPQIIMDIDGTVPVDPTHPAVNFSIQTSATERGIDI